jgi:hypothetical protein
MLQSAQQAYGILEVVLIGACVLGGWKSTVWVYGILPLMFTGTWVAVVTFIVSRMIPNGFGETQPYPDTLGTSPSASAILLYGTVVCWFLHPSF